jgi:hypothetical protein
MHLAELFSPTTAATLRFRGEPYGADQNSRYELYHAVCAYRLGNELQEIDTPLLITDPQDEQFRPGQSQQRYDRAPGARQLLPFASTEGANRHREPLACALRDALIFDWLDSYLA